MRTAILALLTVAIVAASSVLPASAGTLRLSLWPTPSGNTSLDSLAPGIIRWDSTVLGLSYRSSPFAGRFIWSISYDTGGVNSLVDTEGGFGASPGSNHFFATSFHYALIPGGSPNAPQVTVFAGYGSGSLEVDIVPGLTRRFETSGFRYGADFYWPFAEGWFVTGSAAFGKWPIRQLIGGINTTPEGSTSVSEYLASLGHMLSPNTSLEAGYRSIRWGDTGPIGATPCSCTMNWGGWFVSFGVWH